MALARFPKRTIQKNIIADIVNSGKRSDQFHWNDFFSGRSLGSSTSRMFSTMASSGKEKTDLHFGQVSFGRRITYLYLKDNLQAGHVTAMIWRITVRVDSSVIHTFPFWSYPVIFDTWSEVSPFSCSYAINIFHCQGLPTDGWDSGGFIILNYPHYRLDRGALFG